MHFRKWVFNTLHLRVTEGFPQLFPSSQILFLVRVQCIAPMIPFPGRLCSFKYIQALSCPPAILVATLSQMPSSSLGRKTVAAKKTEKPLESDQL